MSTLQDTDLDRLLAAAQRVRDLQAAADHALAYRDELIRSLRAQGHSVIKIAEALGMGRARLYVVLDAPPPEAGDHAYLDFIERFDAAWETAVDAWQEAGQHGSADDYFPLEALVERRP